MAIDRRLEHRSEQRPIVQPFDGVASDYDLAFTEQELGRWLRRRVWQQFAVIFRPGDQVIDLGCGTGADAIWLAERGVRVIALDASAAMLEVALSKAERAGVIERISFIQLDIGRLEKLWDRLPNNPDEAFAGAISNFGPLNCLPDRRPLAAELARLIRPGGHLVLGVMGPFCPWEIGWYLAHGRPRTALRRFRAGAPACVGDESLRVWYPSHRRLRREFAPGFQHLDTSGLGIVLPVSDQGGLIPRMPRLFSTLREIDPRLGRTPVGPWLSDHYLSIFERNPTRLLGGR